MNWIYVELIHHGCHRQAGAAPASFFQIDSDVLPHPVYGKAEIKAIFYHGRSAIFYLPGSGRSPGDSLIVFLTSRPVRSAKAITSERACKSPPMAI